MKNLKFLFVILTLPFYWSCSTPAEKTEVSEPEKMEVVIDEGQTKSVVEHHLTAFINNNMEDMLADYTEESVIITPDATVKGLKAIEELMAGMFSLFPSGDCTIELDKMVIDKETAYVLWHGNSKFMDIPFATDTFIIKDGKIMTQTFAGILNPVSADEEQG